MTCRRYVPELDVDDEADGEMPDAEEAPGQSWDTGVEAGTVPARGLERDEDQ